MHGQWFVSLGQQEHAFLWKCIIHLIQVTWFTHIFSNIRKVSEGLNLLGPSDKVVSPDILRLF